MDALTFLKAKFPMWEIQDRGPFNTVSLREENLIEAMEEYADLKGDEFSGLKTNESESPKFKAPVQFIEEFPFQMFCPNGRKSNTMKPLLSFQPEYRFPEGYKVTDLDKDQKLVEIEGSLGERCWVELQQLFPSINLSSITRIKQNDGTLINVIFHSAGSYPGRKGEQLFLTFEIVS